MQPLLSEASLTLALSLIEHQLSIYNLERDLSLSIIKFLSVVASTAKKCTLTSGRYEAPPIYTPTQAAGIINLLNETKVLRHVMKVPEDIRSDPNFECYYSVVVKSLAPTRRGKHKVILRRGTTTELQETPSPIDSLPVSPHSATSAVPPPKPMRLFRQRRSTGDGKSKVCL